MATTSGVLAECFNLLFASSLMSDWLCLHLPVNGLPALPCLPFSQEVLSCPHYAYERLGAIFPLFASANI